MKALFFLIPFIIITFIFVANEIQAFKEQRKFYKKQFGREDGWID